MEALGLINIIILLIGDPLIPWILKCAWLMLVKENYGLIWIVINFLGNVALIDDLGAKKEVRILLLSHGSR